MPPCARSAPEAARRPSAPGASVLANGARGPLISSLTQTVTDDNLNETQSSLTREFRQFPV